MAEIINLNDHKRKKELPQRIAEEIRLSNEALNHVKIWRGMKSISRSFLKETFINDEIKAAAKAAKKHKLIAEVLLVELKELEEKENKKSD